VSIVYDHAADSRVRPDAAEPAPGEAQRERHETIVLCVLRARGFYPPLVSGSVS
jgi:hypothetical protein